MNYDIEKKLAYSDQRLVKEKQYWMNKLSGDIPGCSFPYDTLKNQTENECGTFGFNIPYKLSQKLIRLSGASDQRMLMVLATLVGMLVYKYTYYEDITISIPVFRRDTGEKRLNSMLVLRVGITEGMTFKELLYQVKQTVIEANENQNYPVDKVIEELYPTSIKSGYDLMNTVVLLTNINDREYVTHQPDCLFSFSREGQCINGKIEYSTKKYSRFTIEGIYTRLVRFAGDVLDNMDVCISDMEMLSEEERKTILYEFNDPQVNEREYFTLQEIFQEQEKKCSDSIALIVDDEEYTYKQLNTDSSRLAAVLRQKGVMRGKLVGIMLERSAEMIIGILAIIKAGGAYVPIDPELPLERIKFILEDGNIDILLTQPQYLRQMDFHGQVIFTGDYNRNGGEVPEYYSDGCPDDLAYVMYTSGSTGKPKGVMIEQKGIIRLVKDTNYIHFETCDKLLQTGAFMFDASTFEIWGALLNGMTLCMVSNRLMDGETLSRTIKKYNISILFLTTALFNQMADYNPQMFAELKVLITGGEALSSVHAKKIREACKNIRIINGYGPTENTTFSTSFSVTDDYKCNVPIGRPVNNTTAYIFDIYGKLLPIGVTGELHLGGDGLARGYLNAPELTEQKFVSNNLVPDKRIYRTGDLARWLPDGNIEFLGRIDHQIKIRGFRIEPGEIETELLKYKGINNVVVTDIEVKGTKCLCAYIVGDETLNFSGIREYLSQRLPHYMVPSYFTRIDFIPLTTNGKVDKRTLPEPRENIEVAPGYTEPRNQIQKNLADVWQQVLGLDRVGIDDNFFQLGGDSIKAIQVSAKLSELGLKMDLRDLFLYKRLGELSKYITPINSSTQQQSVVGRVELTPTQRWFFENNHDFVNHFNQSAMLYCEEGIKPEKLRKVLDKIVEHHDALRIEFRFEENKVIQFNKGLDGELFSINVVDISDAIDIKGRLEKEAEKIQASMDISKGPLVRLGLFKAAKGDYLLIVIHHLVVDGVSWRIIVEDILNGYRQLMNNEYISFPAKTESYKDWSAKLKKYSTSRAVLNQCEYWANIEKTKVPPLPKDFMGAENMVANSERVTLDLDEEWTYRLLKETNYAYNTEINDILLTALGMTIKEWTLENNVLISLEGHGREYIDDSTDLARTVGWFTSIYPVLLDMTLSHDLPALIKSIKEGLRRIPQKGMGYHILKYLTAYETEIALGFELNPEICFNYMGQFDVDTRSGVFEISDMPTGNDIDPRNRRIYALDINASSHKGKFTLCITYNRYEYERQTIVKLAAEYISNLKSLIQHCSGRRCTELTPSDIGNDKLTIDELNDIIDIVGSL